MKVSPLADSNRNVQRLLQFLKLKAGFESTPGFSHAMNLTASRLGPEHFSYHDKTLTFRYTLSTRLLLHNYDSTIALSTYLSILDDVTTWALMLDDPSNPRPGVSSSLHAEWGAGAPLGIYPGSVVDIQATVTKAGRNLGFVRAEVRDKNSGELVCFGSHTKFLPVGKLMKFLLSPVGRWFLGVYVRMVPPTPSMQVFEMSDMFSSLDFVSHEKAIFHGTHKHSSFGGPLHGGCQAILMELVAQQVAQHKLATAGVRLDSIHVSYLSASTMDADIEVEVVSAEPPYSVTLCVHVKRADGTIMSEGILTFSDSRFKKAKTKAPSAATLATEQSQSCDSLQPSTSFRSHM